jgi:hypothetical protein
MRDIIYKTTTEKFNYPVDVTADKPSSGATISSVSASAVDSSGASATSTLLGTATSSGMIITVPIKNTTTDKENYVVTISATFNDAFGTVANRILEVRVRDSDLVE